MLPVYLHGDSPGTEVEGSRRPNRSVAPERCLDRIGSGIEDLFHHVLAVLHDPTYREANAGCAAHRMAAYAAAALVGQRRPDCAVTAVPRTVGGRNRAGDGFAVTPGWGHFGTGRAVMPGQGRVVEHP